MYKTKLDQCILDVFLSRNNEAILITKKSIVLYDMRNKSSFFLRENIDADFANFDKSLNPIFTL